MNNGVLKCKCMRYRPSSMILSGFLGLKVIDYFCLGRH